MKHCKFVDEILPSSPYTPTINLLHQVGCGFYAHGDDPCFNSEGQDITIPLKEAGMFKMFKRTEGVSTTGITGKLLKLAEFKMANQSSNNLLANQSSPVKQNSP